MNRLSNIEVIAIYRIRLIKTLTIILLKYTACTLLSTGYGIIQDKVPHFFNAIFVIFSIHLLTENSILFQNFLKLAWPVKRAIGVYAFAVWPATEGHRSEMNKTNTVQVLLKSGRPWWTLSASTWATRYSLRRFSFSYHNSLGCNWNGVFFYFRISRLGNSGSTSETCESKNMFVSGAWKGLW